MKITKLDRRYTACYAAGYTLRIDFKNSAEKPSSILWRKYCDICKERLGAPYYGDHWWHGEGIKSATWAISGNHIMYFRNEADFTLVTLLMGSYENV